jgi:iron complex outermembrane recepter protein
MGKRGYVFWAAVFFSFCFSTINCVAAGSGTEASYQAYDLGDVVVSADQTKVKDIAITNEITAEDIKATNSHTVAEALSRAPGVMVTTGAKNQSTVSIHGFDQSRILFLVDGVPFYESKFGILDLNSVGTDNIAKIEIIKGAASVLYGANAEGGVVNIITKKGTEKPFTSASYELSENETHRVSVTNGMKKGIFNYWLNYVFEESDGWALSDDFKPKSGTLTDMHTGSTVTSHPVFENGGDRDNSQYRNQSFWAKFGIEPNENSAYFVNFHYRTREKGVPSNTVSNKVFSRPVFSQFYADRIPEYDEWGIDLDGKQGLTDKLTAKVKLFYHDHNDSLYSYEDPSFDTALAKSHYKDYVAGGTFLLDYQPVTWDAIRLAVNYKGDSHKEVADEYLPYEKYFSYTGSVGLENEFSRVKNLSVIMGVSYDWFEVTEAKKNVTAKNGNYIRQDNLYEPDDDAINPMIGVTYTFADETRVYASAARKSRFPTLNNLYNSIAGGSAYLESEKSNNYTVGVSRPFGSFLKADFSLFRHDVKDRITSEKIGPTTYMYNTGKVRLQGYEVGAEIYPVDKLIFRADYTYTDAKDRSSDRTSDDIANVPRHILNLSGQYTLPVVGTRIDLNSSYMGSVFSNVQPGSVNELHSYWLSNAKLTQEFGKYFEVYVAANNIFDEDYEWGDGYPAQGRNFWSGVTVKF